MVNVATSSVPIVMAPSLQSDLHRKFQQYSFKPLHLRLKHELGMQEAEAAQLVTDLKTWMYLCTVSEKPLSPPPAIDEAWHNFILFTQEYQKFCGEYCGRFVHHVPFDGMQEDSGFDKVKDAARSNSAQLFAQVGLSGKNWMMSSVDSCCNGGNCSNTGNCSHCTSS